jgi:transposase-like protein
MSYWRTARRSCWGCGSLRKILKTRRVFPNDEAATKLIYLAVQNMAKKWTMPIQNRKAALNQFAVLFSGRVSDLR